MVNFASRGGDLNFFLFEEKISAIRVRLARDCLLRAKWNISRLKYILLHHPRGKKYLHHAFSSLSHQMSIKSPKQVRDEYIRLYTNYFALKHLSDRESEYVTSRFGEVFYLLLTEDWEKSFSENKSKIRQDLREMKTKAEECLEATQLHEINSHGDVNIYPATDKLSIDDLINEFQGEFLEKYLKSLYQVHRLSDVISLFDEASSVFH